MTPQQEIGPQVPSGRAVQLLARELSALAALAFDRAEPGARQDVPKAVAALDRARALLGVGGLGDGE